MSPRRILIVGGSDAGTSAALGARSVDPDCAIDMLLDDRFPNFSVCGLPFLLSGEVADWSELAHRSRAELAERRITIHDQHRAIRANHARHELVAEGPEGEKVFSYDRLVIATGAEAVTPHIPGSDLPGVRRVRSMDDGLQVLQRIRSGGVATIAVVGGGYIGVELADAFTRRGARVTLIESTDEPLKTLDVAFGALVATELRRNGVQIAAGVRVESIEEVSSSEGRLRVTGTKAFEAICDLVIVCVGVRPRVALADAMGCARGFGHAIQVTRRMETSVTDVFAAGDCVETWHRLLGRSAYLPLGTTSHKQGAIAGANAAGAAQEFAGTLGTQIVKIFDLAAGRTGLSEDEAMKGGMEPRTSSTSVKDHKAYYPGARDLHIRITGDVRDGRLLGAQIIGDYRASVAKRLDVVATALFGGLRVAQLLDLDLSYTPPLGSPWDPWQAAARAWCDAWAV
jgi:NADPH-dependent 2,4-dienoyl-CoA reductase/sulfur reductase-like enzyme